ncbi:MAG: helix-turn-helix transcriptional regulator, partial [Bacteroidetes bacterium]|nr:helix-turn-helix transcriptional regulator [Bacteroidota bacterium]
SDGNTGMVFIIEGQLKVKNADGTTSDLPGVFVYGQLDNYRDIYSEVDTRVIIVVFQPYGFFRLYGMPADEVKGLIVDACLIDGNGIKLLNDHLRSAGSYAASIAMVENYYLKIFKEPAISTDHVGLVIKQIIRVKGQVTVKQLTDMTGFSERNLERLFQTTIGISPVRYLQIVKLHYFLSLIRSQGNTVSLTQAGLESGYYDQAHLIHNFKQTTGLTPKQYLSAGNSLTVNLLAVTDRARN